MYCFSAKNKTKTKYVHMADSEYTNPLYEASVKLCAAVKKYKCLHDKYSFHKYSTGECENAWQLVSLECEETVDFCKSRWGALRRCFFQALKRRKKFYMHDHLKFLQDLPNKKKKGNPYATLNDETNSNINDTLQKTTDGSLRLEETINADGDDAKSISSRTTSADESHDISQTNQMGVFITSEIEENAGEEDERRLSYKRSCKRPLDPELIDELVGEELEEKRSRKTVTEKYETIRIESSKTSFTPQVTTKQYKLIRDKPNKVEVNKGKMVDRFTCTDKETRDFATQYELNSQDFDDIFMQSIKTELQAMNPRQKMNFKRKIYHSLLEVFDDVADFPKINESLQLPSNQAPPRLINSTVGELRLMRELVSLVQAAKNTPEIMNANEKATASTTVQIKQKMPIAMVEIPSKTKTSTQSVSSSIDDDDLEFLSENINDDNVSLSRSLNENKAKSTESTTAKNEDTIEGLPCHVLQKVVGTGASTIVAHDGAKKRIYRIYPKLINPNENGTLATKNGSSNVGNSFVPPSKNAQDTTANSSKNNNSVSNINIPAFNNKSTNNTNEITNSVNKSSQPISPNTNQNSTNDQPIFKSVHPEIRIFCSKTGSIVTPENRILCSKTGSFITPENRILCSKTGSFINVTPTTYIPKPSSASSTEATAISATTKATTTKFPISPMLPPIHNIPTKRADVGRKIIQRRYSICGPLPANSAATASKNLLSTNNANSQEISSVSQIKISQPITLNTKAMNVQAPFSTHNTAPVGNMKTPVKSLQTFKEPVSNIERVHSAKHGEIPIVQVSGTVKTDVLDPLFFNSPQIKSEPVDE